jgi:hypothetical protein
MTRAYLVTEHDTDLTLLRKLLPPALVSELVFYATNGRSSVYSAAGTLLSDRQRPVVIVLDSQTENPAEIQEKITLANTLLLPAAPLGVPFQVFLAVPTISSILNSEPTIQTLLLSQTDLYQVLERLTSSQIIALQQHPLIRQLIEFLTLATRQIA